MPVFRILIRITLIAMLATLSGCQRSISVDVLWDKDTPIFEFYGSRVDYEDGVVITALSVYKGSYESHGEEVWQLAPAEFGTTMGGQIRYGDPPEGFYIVKGPKPLESCGSYVLIINARGGFGYVEFDTPCSG